MGIDSDRPADEMYGNPNHAQAPYFEGYQNPSRYYYNSGYGYPAVRQENSPPSSGASSNGTPPAAPQQPSVLSSRAAAVSIPPTPRTSPISPARPSTSTVDIPSSNISPADSLRNTQHTGTPTSNPLDISHSNSVSDGSSPSSHRGFYQPSGSGAHMAGASAAAGHSQSFFNAQMHHQNMLSYHGRGEDANDVNNGASGSMLEQHGISRSAGTHYQYPWLRRDSSASAVAVAGPSSGVVQGRSRPEIKTRTRDKYRVVYTEHQRFELEKEYSNSHYITIRRKTEMATSLKLSERQIKIWFQNRRAKDRKQSGKKKPTKSQTVQRQDPNSSITSQSSEGGLPSRPRPLPTGPLTLGHHFMQQHQSHSQHYNLPGDVPMLASQESQEFQNQMHDISSYNNSHQILGLGNIGSDAIPTNSHSEQFLNAYQAQHSLHQQQHSYAMMPSHQQYHGGYMPSHNSHHFLHANGIFPADVPMEVRYPHGVLAGNLPNHFDPAYHHQHQASQSSSYQHPTSSSSSSDQHMHDVANPLSPLRPDQSSDNSNVSSVPIPDVKSEINE